MSEYAIRQRRNSEATGNSIDSAVTKSQTTHDSSPDYTGTRSGVPLTAQQRAFFEPRLKANLSDVRLHTDKSAVQAAEEMNARAYSAGKNIYFGKGEYQPGSYTGTRLLGHELTHTVQHGSDTSGLQFSSKSESQANVDENEARNAGAIVAQGGTLANGVTQRTASTIHLEEKKPQKEDEEIPPGLKPNTKPTSKPTSKPLPEASWDWPRTHLLQPTWHGWTEGGAKGMIFDPKADPDLTYRQLAAIYNLVWASEYSLHGRYGMDLFTSLKTMEKLGGVENTELLLASIFVGQDLEKMLELNIGKVSEEHPLSLSLYGLGLYAAIQGMLLGTESDVDWFTLISAATQKYTEAPRGFERSMLLPNEPDPRWRRYPFLVSSTDWETSFTHKNPFRFDPSKPESLNLMLGLNILPLLSQYKETYDPKKSEGLELYPYLKTGREKGGEPSLRSPFAQHYMGGFFGGDKGYYGQLEGGAALDQEGELADLYTRAGFIMRNKNFLELMQTSLETSYRPGSPEDFRARLNLAATLGWDWNQWNFGVGGRVGGLLPSGESPGAVDLAAWMSLYHKYHKAGVPGPFKTGAELGAMWRHEDPFDPKSGRLTSVKGGLRVLDLAVLSAEYHRYHQGPGGMMPPIPGMPEQDFRLMLNVGPGLLRWFQKPENKP